MKALKEKRINLRSLWRMGLVILSVFALIFAACGSSDDSSTEPGGGEPGNPSVIPQTLVLRTLPNSSSGYVLEGQFVDLTGLELIVGYSDGTSKPVRGGANSPLTAEPAIYDFRKLGDSEMSANWAPDLVVGAFSGPISWDNPSQQPMNYPVGPRGAYRIYYSEGSHAPIYIDIPARNMGNHRRILSFTVHNSMFKQNYIIDEMPNFDGLDFQAMYSYDTNNPMDYVSTAATYFPRRVPFDVAYKEYQWAWVYNYEPSGFPGDDQGVLVKVGSWGDLRSEIRNPDFEVMYPMELTQTRVTVETLGQVSSVTFADGHAPDYSATNIFYDDPSLITRSKDGFLTPDPDAYNVNWDKWIDVVFANVQLKVDYTNGQSRTYGIREFFALGSAPLFNNEMDASGAWPLFRPNSRIGDRDMNVAQVRPGLWETLQIRFMHPTATPAREIDYTSAQEWADWANSKAPTVRFWHRNQFAPTVVPVFNQLRSLTVAPRAGEPETPVMNGMDTVYTRPDGGAQFFNKVVVSATYRRSSDSAEATRADVMADIRNGSLREGVLWSGNIDDGTLLTPGNTTNWARDRASRANVSMAGVPASVLAPTRWIGVVKADGTIVPTYPRWDGGAATTRPGTINIGMINY